MKINAKDLGLTQKESKVYLALFKCGKASAIDLAKELNIRRTTIYTHLNQLKNYGLISNTWQNKKSYFIAENPYKLLSLAERKRQQAQRQEQKIMEIIPAIKALSKKARSLPKTKQYEGIEGMWTVLNEGLRNNGIQYFIGSLETVFKILGREKFTQFYTDKRRKLGSKIYNITDRFKQPDRDYLTDKSFREIKYFPDNIKSNSSVWFYGNKLVIFNFIKPYSIIEIESEEIVDLLKFMFKIVWQALK